MYTIVHVIPALGWGGAQNFCIQLCNSLVKRPGYRVLLISLYHHDPSVHLPLSLLDKKVEFITLGKRRGFQPFMFFRLKKLLEKVRPHVVHTHLHATYYCFYAYLTSAKNQYKKFHTFHSLVRTESPWHGRLALKFFFKRKIIHPVCISKEVYKSAVAEYGRVVRTIINNGCGPVKPSAAFPEVKESIDKLKGNPYTKVLLNVARVNKLKNQQLLIDCVKMLQDEGSDVVVLILGDCNEDEKALYEHFQKTKSDNIHFLGKVTNVGDYYLNANAFVLTSTYEGLPISLLESLSAGLIPVCTPAGGVVDVVREDIGFLSKDFSHQSYMEALKAYLQLDRAALIRMKEKCNEFYQREFSMEKCADAYCWLYES